MADPQASATKRRHNRLGVPMGPTTCADGASRSLLLRLGGLSGIAARTAGSRDVVIALIDGAPELKHECLTTADIASVRLAGCSVGAAAAAAVAHATFLASMLVGRGGQSLGLCQDCRLLSIAAVDAYLLGGKMPTAAVAARLAEAVTVALRGGAACIVFPLDVSPTPDQAWAPLIEAIDEAARHGVRTIMSAGNFDGPSSPVLASPGVVPVAGSGAGLRRWGVAVARWGVSAPAFAIPGADPSGGYGVRSGSSFAAAFVAAAFALLRSLRPEVAREVLWWALLDPSARDRILGRLPPLDADRSLALLGAVNA